MALEPPNEFTLAMYVGPTFPYHGNMAIDALVLDDFDRAAPRGTGSGKVGGNYAPVWPHQMKARSNGFGITLHLDSNTRTFVEEFSTSGFIGIDKTRTLYIPDSPNAITSITSDSLATISESIGFQVKREKIPFSSIGRFSEVLAVGTAANAVPIRSITRISTDERYEFEHHASKETGSEIVERLSNIQRGLEADVFGWNWKVEA
ncbi:Putative branched-chain-amino-acid aminotransferase TOXF [Talaromyces islandicus]|uniref:Putative branched-chain-amino-acid aminotransferase TOXF n=1 Tax=Talaromyces islandicus TaxID=28573 RepID=A0A0U1LYU8_TALIS|nr:Putative branched-chain-amino-acid aminotransferase TOXF [Talaromyces islandicus]